MSVETLMNEFRPVASEECEFGNRKIETIIAFFRNIGHQDSYLEKNVEPIHSRAIYKFKSSIKTSMENFEAIFWERWV